jgi:hypothetical protein
MTHIRDFPHRDPHGLSRSTIYFRSRGKFPKPVSLGTGAPSSTKTDMRAEHSPRARRVPVLHATRAAATLAFEMLHPESGLARGARAGCLVRARRLY